MTYFRNTSGLSTEITPHTRFHKLRVFDYKGGELLTDLNMTFTQLVTELYESVIIEDLFEHFETTPLTYDNVYDYLSEITFESDEYGDTTQYFQTNGKLIERINSATVITLMAYDTLDGLTRSKTVNEFWDREEYYDFFKDYPASELNLSNLVYLESEWDLGFNLPGGNHGIYASAKEAEEVAFKKWKEFEYGEDNEDILREHFKNEVWGDLISISSVPFDLTDRERVM